MFKNVLKIKVQHKNAFLVINKIKKIKKLILKNYHIFVLLYKHKIFFVRIQQQTDMISTSVV